ncbi:MAG: FtsX-like permease family protein [Nanoarchaeota archaeon]|nr:FtsX-like permease family protein [Nanoarchaeota archaeon]
MISRETIKYSLRNLKQRKVRSFFTILSIFIGISTIFIFISFGLGLYTYIGDLTESSSADKIIIQPKGGTLAMFESNVKFTDDDLRAIERVPGVYEVSGSYFKTVEVESQNKRLYTLLFSYDPKKPIIMEVSNIGIYQGRELINGKKEVTLGYNYMIPDRIFPKAIEINQNIEINGEKIKVVGFYEEVGNPSDDAQIYTSNDYMEEFYSGENLSYGWIVAKVDVNNVEDIVGKIEKALRNERNLKEGKEDFSVQSFNDMIEGFSSALNIVIAFVVLIALISVLVSAVNTANTMITSVLERVKEIGVLKSIGARNSDIFGIFLFESGFLGFVAGAIGVAVGFIFTYIGKVALENFGYGFLQPDFSPWLFIGCIIFATITGAISGVFPAINASKINPVEALRYE